MKRTYIILVAFFFMTSLKLMAQKIYIIEGDTLELQREVTGPLTLFWNEEGNTYRYFVQKGKHIQELTNMQEEYKVQLAELTKDSEIRTEEVKFVLYSLKYFVNRYNALVQEDYTANTSTSNIKYRLGLYTGLSNNAFTENPQNIIAPVLGFELEFFDPNLAPRHAAFLQLRQSFERGEYQYNSTQLSINYRFRAFFFTGFDLHVDAELATLVYAGDRVQKMNERGEIIAIKEDDGISFTVPLSFGLGTNIKLADLGFLTVSYNDIVSIVLDRNASFPLDFTVGYKFNL